MAFHLRNDFNRVQLFRPHLSSIRVLLSIHRMVVVVVGVPAERRGTSREPTLQAENYVVCFNCEVILFRSFPFNTVGRYYA